MVVMLLIYCGMFVYYWYENWKIPKFGLMAELESRNQSRKARIFVWLTVQEQNDRRKIGSLGDLPDWIIN